MPRPLPFQEHSLPVQPLADQDGAGRVLHLRALRAGDGGETGMTTVRKPVVGYVMAGIEIQWEDKAYSAKCLAIDPSMPYPFTIGYCTASPKLVAYAAGRKAVVRSVIRIVRKWRDAVGWLHDGAWPCSWYPAWTEQRYDLWHAVRSRWIERRGHA